MVTANSVTKMEIRTKYGHDKYRRLEKYGGKLVFRNGLTNMVLNLDLFGRSLGVQTAQRRLALSW